MVGVEWEHKRMKKRRMNVYAMLTGAKKTDRQNCCVSEKDMNKKYKKNKKRRYKN